MQRLFFSAVLVAAAVRSYLLWQYYCISSDGVVYIQAAQDFFTGDIANGLASVYPPGYPVLIAAMYSIVGNWELAGQLLSLFFGVALLFPLYWMFREVFNEKIAVVACYLAAISPFLALYSVHVRTESPYFFLSALGLYVILSGIQKRRVARLAAGGLITGYAFLVRPEAIGFPVLTAVFLTIHWLTKKDFPVLWAGKAAVAVGAGFFAFALPYIVYLSIDTGRIGAISRKAGITLAINLKESGYLNADGLTGSDNVEELVFTDYVRKHPLRYLTKVASDLPAATGVFFEGLHYSYVPFLLIGLVLIGRERVWERKDFLLLGFVLLYVYGFALIYVKRRYSLQAAPIALGWVALGMCWLWDWLRINLPWRKAKIVGLCIGLVFVLGTLPKTLKPVSREKAYVRDAGRYLKERNRSGELRVAAFEIRVSFYAQAKNILLNPEAPPSLQDHLREHGADYLVAEANLLEKVYPGVLARPEKSGLILENKFVGTRNDQMLVFKVI
jgi:4-amino-4-deoxy-L-arabinose transferase-like glycosyltransferase